MASEKDLDELQSTRDEHRQRNHLDRESELQGDDLRHKDPLQEAIKEALRQQEKLHQEALRKRDEALRKRDEALRKEVQDRDEELRKRDEELRKRDEQHRKEVQDLKSQVTKERVLTPDHHEIPNPDGRLSTAYCVF
jgi:hypothetical protein